jgi:hypothetical protein
MPTKKPTAPDGLTQLQKKSVVGLMRAGMGYEDILKKLGCDAATFNAAVDVKTSGSLPVLNYVSVASVIEAATITDETVTAKEIISHSRLRSVTMVRHKVMWVCNKLLCYSLPAIGRAIGDRDHSTVIHAVNKIDAYLKAGRISLSELEEIGALARMYERLSRAAA